MELQINEFGQTPKQLFKIPHPPRAVVQQVSTPVRTGPLWNIESVASKKTSPVTEVSLHKKKLSSINVLQDRILTTGHDGCVKIVTIDKLQKRSFTVCNLAISSSCIINEKTISVGCYDNNIYIFNIGNGRVSQCIRAHDDAVSALEYIEDLNSIASVSWDAQLKLWDVRAGYSPVSAFEDHEEQILCMSKYNYSITTCDKEGRVVIRDLREGILAKFEIGERIDCVSQSKHSNHLILGQKRSLGLYDTCGSLVTSLPVEGVNCLVSDGVFVLGGQEEGILDLWEFIKGDCVHRWQDVRGVTSLYADDSSGTFYAGNKDGSLSIIP